MSNEHLNLIRQRTAGNDDIIKELLPAGQLTDTECRCANEDGVDKGRSFRLDRETGLCIDHENGSGTDIIHVYANRHSMSYGEAVTALENRLGIEGQTNEKAKPKKKGPTPIVPIPDDVPTPTFKGRHGDPLAIWVYKDKEGKRVGFVVRYPEDAEGKKVIRPKAWCLLADGRMGWREKAMPAPRPLYRLPELLDNKVLPIMITEGEKAADAANKIGAGCFFATTWAGGASAVKHTDWSHLKGKLVFIWPDKDNAGAKAALDVAEALKQAGAELAGIILPDAAWPDKADAADFIDWTNEQFRKEIYSRIVSLEDFIKEAKERYGSDADSDKSSDTPFYDDEGTPPDYKVKETGLFFVEKDKDGNRIRHKVSSPIKVTAMSRSLGQMNWGREIVLLTPDDFIHTLHLPTNAFSKGAADCYALLAHYGLTTGSHKFSKSRLQRYLEAAQPTRRVVSVGRIGWHGDTYVLPDRSYSPDGIEYEVVLQTTSTTRNAFNTRGTLEGWQEPAKMCIGNSRLVCPLCAAFAAPLLELIGEESGGIHLVGISSIGKTTILNVASSPCGGSTSEAVKGYTNQWLATENAIEGLAVMRCDALLCLDEMGQVDGKIVALIIYKISNNQGKARFSVALVTMEPHEWRTFFLSTGEVTLEQKMFEDSGKRPKGGVGIRSIDLPADAEKGMGAFEYIHGYSTPAAFAQALSKLCKEQYGTAFRAFIEYLVKNKADVTDRLQKYIQEFVDKHLPKGSEGQFMRVCRRFALLAAAGRIAIEAGILPWPIDEPEKAAVTCMKAHLKMRGGAGASEIRNGLKQIVEFFQSNPAKFERMDKDAREKVIDRFGYIKSTPNGPDIFCVFPIKMPKICEGFSFDSLEPALRKKGWLIPGKDGKAAATTWVPQEGKSRRLVNIPSSILDGLDEIDDMDEDE
ncbi:MAG: DUF927 domain-containing protein [Pseudodesulfovibrio sp.]|nr:DUF927 domain-containing protein [Pseudodesulfovibrio sp.]